MHRREGWICYIHVQDYNQGCPSITWSLGSVWILFYRKLSKMADYWIVKYVLQVHIITCMYTITRDVLVLRGLFWLWCSHFWVGIFITFDKPPCLKFNVDMRILIDKALELFYVIGKSNICKHGNILLSLTLKENTISNMFYVYLN